MSCRICKRSSCTESFHSLKEQEAYDEFIEDVAKGTPYEKFEEWLKEQESAALQKKAAK